MHSKPSIWRTLVAGLAGRAAFVLGTFLTFAQLAGSRRGDPAERRRGRETAPAPTAWCLVAYGCAQRLSWRLTPAGRWVWAPACPLAKRRPAGSPLRDRRGPHASWARPRRRRGARWPAVVPPG